MPAKDLENAATGVPEHRILYSPIAPGKPLDHPDAPEAQRYRTFSGGQRPKLLKLVKRYLDPSELEPDGKDRGNLLSDVKAFEKASLSGEYYESFNVNSKNCTEKSTGTRAWIADCHRLLDCCTTQAKKGDPVDVRQAFEIIFGLLDHIDECLDDVIFFADEAGSWQVGVDWNKVLPSWFRVLSATAGPKSTPRGSLFCWNTTATARAKRCSPSHAGRGHRSNARPFRYRRS